MSPYVVSTSNQHLIGARMTTISKPMPAVESKFCQRGSLQNCEAGISRWQWRRSLRTNARLSGLALLLTVCVACSSSEPESTLKFVVEPLVNPNTASTSELQALPHLGEADIAAIVAARPYATPSELHNVLSAALTETELADIYMVLFLPVGLNNGAEADFASWLTNLKNIGHIHRLSNSKKKCPNM